MINEILVIASIFCRDYGVVNCSKVIRLIPEGQCLPILSDPKHPNGRAAHGYYSPKNDVISLNQDHISNINKWELMELVYHEMAHAYFDISHNNKVSIMNPFNPNSDYWVHPDGSNWDYLKNELRLHIRLKP